MKKYTIHITSGIVSALWLLLTGWIALGHHISFLFSFCFLFHLIPWGIGFAEGTTIWFYIVYVITWIALAFMFSPIVRAYYYSKRKRLFIILSVGPIVVLILVGLCVDFANDKKRQELIALNEKQDKADFSHIRTGDLLFQVIANDSLDGNYQITDSTYNNIGIAFIEYGNYALLETKDQVQFVSMRQWVKRGVKGHYVVKRLVNADSLLSTENQNNSFEKSARKYLMNKIDTSFEWTDDKIYNSELVWKVFKQEFDIELGKLKIKDITVSASNFESRIDYKISTKDIFNSDYLITVERE